MTPEQVTGYVLSGLSLVAFWVVKLCHQASNKCVSVDGNIDTSLRWALKEFGAAVPTASINNPVFAQAVDHLLQLYRCRERIGQLGRVTRALMWLALIGFSLVLILVVLGMLVSSSTGEYVRFVGLIVPFLLLLCQVALLVIAHIKDNEVEKIKVQLEQEQERYSTSWDSE